MYIGGVGGISEWCHLGDTGKIVEPLSNHVIKLEFSPAVQVHRRGRRHCLVSDVVLLSVPRKKRQPIQSPGIHSPGKSALHDFMILLLPGITLISIKL